MRLSLQNNGQLRFVLLRETLHEVWTVSDRDPNRDTPDNKERSAFKGKGEMIWYQTLP